MSLVPVLRGELETIALVGNRRIELAYRRIQDKRSLQDFIERIEQIEDFRQLIEAQELDAPWALHYLGTGGIGKTTFIRYITANLTQNISTAPLCFYFLNPGY